MIRKSRVEERNVLGEVRTGEKRRRVVRGRRREESRKKGEE